MYSHYILTRYNVGLYADNPPYSVAEGWMERRLPLFERTALSVARQQCQSFEWIVIIDPLTPWTLRRPIMELLPENAFLKEARDLFLTDLNMEWPEGDLLTSRVDNDDVLLPEYVGRVQENVNGQPQVIDSFGWVYDMATGRRRPPVWDGKPGSMFVSLYETERPFQTVCAWQHPKIVKVFPTRMIPERLWEITVHDENINNHVNS